MHIAKSILVFSLLVSSTATGCYDKTTLSNQKSEANESTETDSNNSTTGSDENSTLNSLDANDAGVSCDDYCALMEVCEDEHAQYSTSVQCKTVCENFDKGDEGDKLGDSLACRYYHAIQAGENPEDSCLNAGPTGHSVCGGLCDSFCSMVMSVCEGDNAPYNDVLECLDECKQLDKTLAYHASAPDANTYACRVKHLAFASLDPTVHCSHVTVDSEGHCPDVVAVEPEETTAVAETSTGG